jgi:hypothetical protein
MTRTHTLIAASALVGGLVGAVFSPLAVGADAPRKPSTEFQVLQDGPRRLVDTRTSAGEYWRPGPDGGDMTFYAGPTATAIAVCITVVDADEGGFLTGYAADAARPNTSLMSFHAGDTVTTCPIIPTAVNDGGFTIYSSTGADVVIDASGTFTLLGD